MIIIPKPAMLSRSWNREYDRSPAPIVERIQWASERFECEVDLRGVATLNAKEGTHEWAYVRAVVGPKSSGAVTRQPLQYPHVRFVHEIVSVASFLKRLADLHTEENKDQYSGKFQIGDLTANLFSSQRGWDTASRTSGDRMCSSPHWGSWFSVYSRVYSDELLVSSKPDHPLYESLSKLRADVGGFDVYHPDDVRLRSFGVFVVDQRGRFENLSATGEGIVIALDGSELANLTLQLRTNEIAWSARAAESITLPTFQLPTTVQAALISEEDELLDWSIWDVYPAADESELRDLIYGGESEQVEFKPWANEGEKVNEIVDTVIAMSNGHAAGTLLIGIDNYGRPDWTKMMRKFEDEARKGTREKYEDDRDKLRVDAAGCYALYIRELLGQRITPSPRILHEVLEYAGGIILRLSILPSETTTFDADTHKVLVRRGGSNRVPPPERQR
jgi:hypothetical protein